MVALVSKAQTSSTTTLGKTTFGFRGGVNFQNFNGKDVDGNTIKNNLVTRFHAGINIEIPVATDFYFQPGILYNSKGSLRKQTISGQPYNSNYMVNYIEVPLNLVYKPLLGSGHLIIGFGPYVAYGIGGKAKYDLAGNSHTEKIKFKNSVGSGDATDVTYFRPFESGANLLFGYEFSNRLSFQLNVQLGLTKINPSYSSIPNDKASVKNTGFGLSLGYRL